MAVKALAALRICKGSPETLLLDNAINMKISSAGKFTYLDIKSGSSSAGSGPFFPNK